MFIRNAMVTAALLLGLDGVGWAAADRFERLAVYLEQNVQDEDLEVKFEAVAPSVGLTSLKVMSPDGRTVVDFTTPGSKLGIQHLLLESPEPKNDGTLQADFPEGMYRFTAMTAKGNTLEGEARLTHKLPEPVSLIGPHPDAQNAQPSGLRVRWKPGRNVTGYIVIVEEEKSGREMSANLPPSARSANSCKSDRADCSSAYAPCRMA
jgi:hypothetical protein